MHSYENIETSYVLDTTGFPCLSLPITAPSNPKSTFSTSKTAYISPGREAIFTQICATTTSLWFSQSSRTYRSGVRATSFPAKYSCYAQADSKLHSNQRSNLKIRGQYHKLMLCYRMCGMLKHLLPSSSRRTIFSYPCTQTASTCMYL